MVPTIHYQLFTMLVPFADAAFPVVFALMSRKMRALYSAVLQKIKDLVPDFEEASVSAFQDVFGDINVACCWFHYAQTRLSSL